MEKSDKLKNTIYTIGHSNLDSDEFTSLLKKNSIDVIADVRSQPYSKFHPQFNKEFLEKSLLQKGIQYVFMGKEFGARRDETSCYVNGKVSYQRVWELPLFKKGIDRIKKGVNKYNIALMCAEYDPKMCHRTILVGRFIEKIGITVEHILKNGDVINHKNLEQELVILLKLPSNDMFLEHEKIIDKAYTLQEEKISYDQEKKVINEL